MQLWTRAMLKSRAKVVLQKHYWTILLACFIAGLLTGGGSSGISSGASFSNNGSSAVNPGFLIAFGVIMLVLSIFSFAFIIFVGNVVQVGLCRYLMEARQGRTDIATLFWAFREGRYLKVVKTMFFYTLYITLWTLLFIIPGIVKSYEYYYVTYILAENPEIDTRRALQLSKSMTDGEKGKIFVLGLSFLGWALLGAMACGIGLLFLSPYIAATNAELYAFVRERAMNRGLAGQDELKGFDKELSLFERYQQLYQTQQPPPADPPESNDTGANL